MTEYEIKLKTKLDKYYIYQGGGKPRRIKERIQSKLELDFRGLITITVRTTVYGRNVDYFLRSTHYVLDNTNWTKITIDEKNKLIVANGLKYEHIDLEDY